MREYAASALTVLSMAVMFVSAIHGAATAPVGAPAVPPADTTSTALVPDLATPAMMLPIYEGRTDAASLRPFNEWVARRIKAGAAATDIANGADAALDHLCDARDTEIRQALGLVRRLRTERETLLKQAVAARAAGQSVSSFAARYARLPTVPTRSEILPHSPGTTEATVTPAAARSSTNPATPTSTLPTSSTAQDWAGLIESLNRDGASLNYLAVICQAAEVQAVQARMEAQSRVQEFIHDTRKSLQSAPP